MDKFTIRLIQEGDVDEYVQSQKTAWGEIFPNDDIGITKEDIDIAYDDTKIARVKSKVLTAISLGVDKSLDVMLVDNLFAGATYITEELIDGEKFGRIQMIFITPEYAGKGYGTKLFLHALEKLKNQGYTNFSVHTTPYNHRAIKFYKKFGFEVDDTKVPEFKISAPREKLGNRLKFIL
jgi:ribosomal protein S18 acetylase RimI-like enzyme